MSERDGSRYTAVELDDRGVATLTITNSKSMNVLGTPQIRELTTSLASLAEAPGVRVLVLRGTGDKAFVGGADIHEMAGLDAERGERFISGLAGLCESVRRFPVPVIARLAGWCLGGGLELAMACDLRLASADARFGMPEVVVGIPSVIHAALMPRLIGASRASWMLLTGENVDAAAALEWGLVHEVHELSALDDAIAATARRIAGFGPAVVRQQKRLLRSWEEMSIPDAVAASVREFGQAFVTGEPQRFMAEFTGRKRGA